MRNIKKRVMDYFRYHHFGTMAGTSSNTKYMQTLNALEARADLYIDAFDAEQEQWENIRAAINKISENDLIEIYETYSC